MLPNMETPEQIVASLTEETWTEMGYRRLTYEEALDAVRSGNGAYILTVDVETAMDASRRNFYKFSVLSYLAVPVLLALVGAVVTRNAWYLLAVVTGQIGVQRASFRRPSTDIPPEAGWLMLGLLATWVYGGISSGVWFVARFPGLLNTLCMAYIWGAWWFLIAENSEQSAKLEYAFGSKDRFQQLQDSGKLHVRVDK